MRFSYFVILVLGLSLFFGVNSAFADHAEVTIIPAAGSGAPGCEETSSGCFIPSIATVDVGGVVIMSNTDSAAHTFTAGTPGDGPSGEFDTGLLMAGTSFEYSPDTVGEIPYVCMVHPWMVGVIIVQEAEIEELESSISVWSDSSSYTEGETIQISGTVTNPKPGTPVSIIVKAPNGNLVSIASVVLNYDNSFSTEITAGGALMGVSGTYLVQTQYGTENISDSVSFYYSPPTYPASAPYGTDVTIPRDTGAPGCEESNSCYSPYRITVDEGETVTWYNADSAAHMVTSGTPGDGPSGEFDSGLLMSGNSFSHKFYNSGTYDYFCMVHPWSVGIVSVSTSYTPPTYTQPTSDSGILSVSGVSVPYSITGGKVLSIMPDLDAKSLIISITAKSNGSITLTLPRTLIDATTNRGDDKFFVLVDGEEVNFDEKTLSASRILTISFSSNVNEIEIVGTTIIGTKYTPPSNTPPTNTPTYTPPTYAPPVTVPDGTNVVIPSGTGSPGCEESNSCYEPRTFVAGKGSTVTWFNSDSAAHTVTSGTPGGGPSGEFDSGLFMSGVSFSHKFNDDGTYPYFCMVHPWMEGKVSITRSGTIYEAPTPIMPTPTPTPTPGNISISVNDSQYSPSDLVTVNVSTSKNTNVAISVIGPNGDSVVSRSLSTNFAGNGSLQFKLPESSPDGTYKIDSTATISGSKVSDSASFTVKSSTVRVNITSIQPTDQQGNVVSSFTKGKLGFAKIVLSSDSNVPSLVTINLFDSDLTSLGIGSFKTTLSSGQSEMTLSFFIPNDAEFGNGNIYANVFSDWPSQGGVPLTGESATQVRIK